MDQLFKGEGYATAIFGKSHLGSESQSVPTAHGFDEYYGIPPGESWDSALYVDGIEVTHSVPAPRDALLARGPHIGPARGDRARAWAGCELRTVEGERQEIVR